jgi:hypothetical protein
MGVREEHEADLVRVERERLEVEGLLPVATLVHAAIDQEARAPDLHDIVGPRHLASGTVDL